MFFCLASGAAFGAMAVFGKLAYAEGATVGTLLALRFLFASGLFWVGTATTVSKEGQSLWRDICRVKGSDPFILRRDVLLALGLGAGGYAVQAGLYFAALSRIDAGLLSLLVFTFPVIVAVAAVALGRERLTAAAASALAIALGRDDAVRRQHGRDRHARRRAGPGRRGALQRVHPRQRGRGQADAAAAARHARLHGRGRRAHGVDRRARPVPARGR